MSDIYETITKGMIQAGVFVDGATGDDLRTMLPTDTVEALDAFGGKAVKKSAARSADAEEYGMASDEAFDDLPEEVLDHIAALEAKVVELSKRLGDEPSEDEVVESVLKSLDPGVAAIIKSQRDQLRETRDALASERAERIRKAFVAKAAEYDALTTNEVGINEIADMLQTVAGHSPESAERLDAVLAKALKLVDNSGLFGEAGRSGGEDDGATAWDKATSIAKALIEQGEADSIEEARAVVWQANPDLFDQYEVERRQGIQEG